MERGADANARDPTGVPLAVYALIRNERATFELLAKHGLDPLLAVEASDESVWAIAVVHGWDEAELERLFPGVRRP